MSYNNYVDTNSARRAAFDFEAPCVAVIKHSNPCGIATGISETCSAISTLTGRLVAMTPPKALRESQA
jgi:AICAR transformylase/IMP cyclohydrolase PurH